MKWEKNEIKIFRHLQKSVFLRKKVSQNSYIQFFWLFLIKLFFSGFLESVDYYIFNKSTVRFLKILTFHEIHFSPYVEHFIQICISIMIFSVTTNNIFTKYHNHIIFTRYHYQSANKNLNFIKFTLNLINIY